MQYKLYAERDGVRAKVSVREKKNTSPWAYSRHYFGQFEVDSRAVKVCEFHG